MALAALRSGRSWLAWIALFVLAAIPRVHDLSAPSLSTDEVRWIQRGDRMVQTARLGHPWRATAHLSHPGIPAAALIGLGQRWGGRLGIQDPVVAARLPLAVVGASLPPLLYAAASPIWGAPVAMLSSVVLALDPRHVAASRTAHLDVVFGLFYGLAVWAFWRRDESLAAKPGAGSRAPLRLGAVGAMALGLAEATRTSGVVAGLTILLVTALARLRTRRFPLDAGQLRWLGLAVAIFLVVFGKLWLSPSEIPRRERYPEVPAVERALASSSSRPNLALGAAIALIAGGVRFRRVGMGMVLLSAGASLAAAVLEPDLVRNVAGFAQNLVTSPERLHHRYYGESGAALPGKYLTVLLDGMPTPLFLALVAGLPVFALRSWRDDSLRGRAGVALTTAVLVFLVIAHQLDKIAFRYLMPIQPMIALVVGWSLWSVARTTPFLRRSPATGVAAVAVILAVDVLPVAPHYSAWRSLTGSWLHAEVGLPSAIAHEGHDQAASLLWRRASPSDRVSALCYDDVLRHYWTEVLPRREGEGPKPMPEIGYYRIDETDWLVLSARRRRTASREIRGFADTHEPVLRVEVLGEVAIEVFDVTAARSER